MDEEMEFEFNEKIMNALMKKAQDSNAKCAVLEKDLGVKEAELQYLAKLYDEKTTSLTQELESEKEDVAKLNEQINEIADKLAAINNETSNSTSEKENFSVKLVSLIEELEKLRNELQEANKKIDEQQILISQQEAKIQEMIEQIKNKDIIIEEQTAHFETLEMELKEYKGTEAIAGDTSNGDRLKCSKCGSVGKDIKVVEDKTKPLSYVGNMPMYAKIHVCKRCGFQF